MLGSGLRAQGIIGKPSLPSGIPSDVGALESVIKVVFNTAYVFAGVACLAYLVLGGYKIMMSTGDPQKMDQGIKTVAYAVAGLATVLITALLVEFMAGKLGIAGGIWSLNLPSA